MAYRNYLPGDLHRRFDQIKVSGSEEDGVYEPSMVIYRDSRPGKSFIIPLGAIWKYLRMDEYEDPGRARFVDRQDFDYEKEKWLVRKNRMDLMPPMAMDFEKKLLAADWAAIVCAEGLATETDMMLCCALNVLRLMQMMDLWGIKGEAGRAAYQLFEFIRSGLDELKNLPEIIDETPVAWAGEVELFQGSSRLGGKEIGLTETDLIEGN